MNRPNGVWVWTCIRSRMRFNLSPGSSVRCQIVIRSDDLPAEAAEADEHGAANESDPLTSGSAGQALVDGRSARSRSASGSTSLAGWLAPSADGPCGVRSLAGRAGSPRPNMTGPLR